jgi:hypothetical protein
LLEKFKVSQELLEGEKDVTLSILSIAIKAIRTALKVIVDAEGYRYRPCMHACMHACKADILESTTRSTNKYLSDVSQDPVGCR